MFWNKKKKEPKRIVEITIEVNLYNFEHYLDEVQPSPISRRDWDSDYKYTVIQKNRIFIMPASETQPLYYFHHSICQPKYGIAGVQTLSATGTKDVREYCKEKGFFGYLEWSLWHNFLVVYIDSKQVGHVPVDEAILLQLTGKTSSTIPLSYETEVIKFPTNVDDSTFFSMRQTMDSNWVSYSNEFLMIRFEIPTNVDYDDKLIN